MTSSSSPSPPGSASTPPEKLAAAGFSTLHHDIIESHILTRLDGPSLASAATSSTTLRHLSNRNNLWSKICHSTWPSTACPRVNKVICTFPDGGPRSFFSDAFPISSQSVNLSRPFSPPVSKLISAVDIYYGEKLIFSKHQETETLTDWFRCSPCRIDMLEPKEVVPTEIKFPIGDPDTCTEIRDSMTLSWILIDSSGSRAVNLSSHEPVNVSRHWLTGEFKVRFASILTGDRGHVQCGVVVTCGGSDGGDMHVREVSLEMEDMDGVHLNGRDSLVILQGALEGKRGSGMSRVQDGKRRYNQYLEMKGERRDGKLRAERVLDTLCVGLGVSIFVAFWCFILW